MLPPKRWIATLALVGLNLPFVHHYIDVPAAKAEAADTEVTEIAYGTGPDAATLDRFNPEWLLLSRLFGTLSVASKAIAVGDDNAAERSRLASVATAAAQSLDQLEQRSGQHRLLLPYSRARAFVIPGARSLFVDGEILMVASAAAMAWPTEQEVPPELIDTIARRRAQVVASMEAAGDGFAESYPNECWVFDHAIALASLRMAAAVGATYDRELEQSWITKLKQLRDRRSGLLPSSLQANGAVLDGAEGSTIWVTTYALALIDSEFASDQHQLAKAALFRDVFGFGVASEWPAGHRGAPDVDSGVQIPIIEASPSSSGLALLSAAAMNDDAMLLSLRRSLHAFAGPTERPPGGATKSEGRGRRYALAGSLGSGVAALAGHGTTLWDSVNARLQSEHASQRPTPAVDPTKGHR